MRLFIVDHIPERTMTYWEQVCALKKDPKTTLSKEEVITLLKKNNLYTSLEGKARNRSLYREDPNLFAAIYKHTKQLEEVFRKQKAWKGHYSFYKRILFLVKFNGEIEKLKCACGKKYTWTTYCRYCPDYKRNQLGKPHSEETRQKMRVSTLKYLQDLNGQLAPRYNPSSIPLIEKFGADNGYNFMHAENGGEYFVKELGYFLDAYDPIARVALEVDESHHFTSEGDLKERDKIRQKQIEEALDCTFFRITI